MYNKQVNDPWRDPLLYTSFDAIPDRILFDCGYMFGLTLREIQRINSIFVSHTHFDHFMGFDHFLRMCIDRKKEVELFGPAGFIENVKGKLAGYSWNLAATLNLNFYVTEVREECIEKIYLKASEEFKIEHRFESTPFNPVLKSTPMYEVRSAILDHHIPSLAFSIQESSQYKVNKGLLKEMQLVAGPWLGELKAAMQNGDEISGEFEQNGVTYNLKELSEKLFELRRGKKISYIVDTLFSPITIPRAIDLIYNSDEFYCEAAFLDTDGDKALKTHHLTTRQAVILAHLGRVKQLIPIHISSRYAGNADFLKDFVAETQFTPETIS